LVDAFHGLDLMQRQPEAIKQIAMADRIFITKMDLATDEVLQTLRDALTALNPRADQVDVLNGDIDPALLTGLGLHSAVGSSDALRFLGEDIQSPSSNANASAEGRYLGATPSRHDAAIRTLSLRFAKPFVWTGFSAALELLTTLRGPDMLRVKGIVNVEGKPVVVQGVQHIFSPPIELDQWPSADRDSRLVFITRNIESDTIRNLMSAVTSL
jgi:G3E family GTPase